MSLWDGGIVKVAPDGTVVPGFPKPTYASSTTTMMSQPAVSDVNRMAAMPNEAATSRPLLADPEPEPFQMASVDNLIQSSLQSNVVSALSPRAGRLHSRLRRQTSGCSHRSPWTPGATISLTVEDGGLVVYSDSQVADADGYFNFNFGGHVRPKARTGGDRL